MAKTVLDSSDSKTKIHASLLDLPDEIILKILCEVNTSDIVNMFKVNRRLARLATEPILWRHVNLCDIKDLDRRRLNQLLRYTHCGTDSLFIVGNNRKNLIGQHTLDLISERCLNLETLSLSDCGIAPDTDLIASLPSSLKWFQLVNCNLSKSKDKKDVISGIDTKRKDVMSGISTKCPTLRHLTLENCGWLSTHTLLPLSKLNDLEYLDLRKCFRLGGEICYTSIATMFGFRKLKTLDVRMTRFCDSEIDSFSRLPNLHTIKLQSLPNDGCTVYGVYLLAGRLRNQLRSLTLNRMQLPENVFDKLFALVPKLKFLDISECTVSEEKINEIRIRRPDVELISGELERKFNDSISDNVSDSSEEEFEALQTLNGPIGTVILGHMVKRQHPPDRGDSTCKQSLGTSDSECEKTEGETDTSSKVIGDSFDSTSNHSGGELGDSSLDKAGSTSDSLKRNGATLCDSSSKQTDAVSDDASKPLKGSDDTNDSENTKSVVNNENNQVVTSFVHSEENCKGSDVSEQLDHPPTSSFESPSEKPDNQFSEKSNEKSDNPIENVGKDCAEKNQTEENGSKCEMGLKRRGSSPDDDSDSHKHFKYT